MKIQELGYAVTPLGELTLRTRVEPQFADRLVYEVKLGDEYLMSSLFTESERQLATLGIAPLDGELDVVIGGLGLGYTAVEALKSKKVSRLLVIDIFQAVIDWHAAGLVPNGEILIRDTRCQLIQGDFFGMAVSGFDVENPLRKFNAILLDIDHSPEHHLDPQNQSFYTTEGLGSIKGQLKSDGIFALWSNDRASDEFTAHLRSVFASATAHDIEFPNPYTGANSVNSVYVARVSL